MNYWKALSLILVLTTGMAWGMEEKTRTTRYLTPKEIDRVTAWAREIYTKLGKFWPSEEQLPYFRGKNFDPDYISTFPVSATASSKEAIRELGDNMVADLNNAGVLTLLHLMYLKDMLKELRDTIYLTKKKALSPDKPRQNIPEDITTAEAFNRAMEQLNKLQKGYEDIQIKYKKSKENYSNALVAAGELKKQIQELTDEGKQSTNEFKKLKFDYDNLNKKLKNQEEAFDRDYENLAKKLNEARKNNNLKNEQIEYLVENARMLEAKNAESAEELNDLNQELRDIKEEYAEVNVALNKAIEDRADLEEKLRAEFTKQQEAPTVQDALRAQENAQQLDQEGKEKDEEIVDLQNTAQKIENNVNELVEKIEVVAKPAEEGLVELSDKNLNAVYVRLVNETKLLQRKFKSITDFIDRINPPEGVAYDTEDLSNKFDNLSDIVKSLNASTYTIGELVGSANKKDAQSVLETLVDLNKLYLTIEKQINNYLKDPRLIDIKRKSDKNSLVESLKFLFNANYTKHLRQPYLQKTIIPDYRAKANA